MGKRGRPKKPETVVRESYRVKSERQKRTSGEKYAPRTKGQIVKDDALVSEYYAKGWTMAQIADEIGVDVSTVSRSIKRIHEAWKEAAAVNYDSTALQQLRKLDMIEKEAWEAWERSVGDSVKLRKEAGFNSKGNFERQVEILEKQAGASEYLRLVLDCVDKRAKLLGLDAPLQVMHKHSVSMVDPREAKDKLSAWVESFRKSGPALPAEAGASAEPVPEDEVVDAEFSAAE